MAAAGFNRDATQLRTKWKHLKQDYKVELVRIEKNGAASSRMSYFHLLHEVLSCKPNNAMTYLCEVVSSESRTKGNMLTDFQSNFAKLFTLNTLFLGPTTTEVSFSTSINAMLYVLYKMSYSNLLFVLSLSHFYRMFIKILGFFTLYS